jgi:hypothetical protein
MPELNLLDPYKMGYTLAQIAPLVRDGYAFHKAQRAWYMFDLLDTGECIANIAFLVHGDVEKLSVKSHNTLAAKFAARKLADKAVAKHPLAMATQYGFNQDKAQDLLDRGFKWQFGTFVRKERTSLGYRTTIAFLDSAERIRFTVGVAEELPKSERRAYRYVRLIQEHGALITAFHAQADAAEKAVA